MIGWALTAWARPAEHPRPLPALLCGLVQSNESVEPGGEVGLVSFKLRMVLSATAAN